MNFKKLQEMQRALDDAILKEKHEMTAEERFEKTLVALSVEVAELANTAEHFKFWKENKGKIDSKRFEKMNVPEYMKGKVEINYWDNNKNTCITLEQAHKLTLVEEASDCLHFILSLANQIEVELHNDFEFETTEEELFLDLGAQMQHLRKSINDDQLFRNTIVTSLVDIFLSYTKNLGITTKELEQAYYDKNEINYQRLEQGY